MLNKADYSFAPAVETLSIVRRYEIPLILASSKTEPEMRQLADEMRLADAPLICENGGVLFWSRQACDGSAEEIAANKVVLGIERSRILSVLANLRDEFQFESFEDLQIAGISRTTDLPPERAARALQRSCTEPLLWHDAEERISAFRLRLAASDLTLTRGGRFWHVAGQTNKGQAAKYILDQWFEASGEPWISIGIGDSPIDQSMLDVVDYPIAIPAPDGVVHVNVEGDNSTVADVAGASGWADSVSRVLSALA